eukprot:5878-Heterococcus_DN1.PRE.2
MLAAETNQLHALRWLREHGCPCDYIYACMFAAHGGSVSVMAYMLEEQQQQQEIGLDAAARTAFLAVMLRAAGANGKLAAAQWLRAQGAAWPARLQYTFNHKQQQWSGAVLEWARSEGCTSSVE